MIILSIHPMQSMLLCYQVTKINLQAIYGCLVLANTWDTMMNHPNDQKESMNIYFSEFEKQLMDFKRALSH